MNNKYDIEQLHFKQPDEEFFQKHFVRTKLDISIFIDLFPLFSMLFPKACFIFFLTFPFGFWLIRQLFLIACCIYLITNVYTIVIYGLVYIIIVKLSVMSILSLWKEFYIFVFKKNCELLTWNITYFVLDIVMTTEYQFNLNYSHVNSVLVVHVRSSDCM